MSRAKGSGDGSIWQEASGRWRGQFRLPNGIIRNFQGETRKAVRDQIFEIKREVKAGLHGSLKDRETFQQFAEEYLISEKQLRRRTITSYRSILRCHMDHIGNIPLAELRPRDLQSHYAKKLVNRSTTTVHHIHQFFHVVLERAVRLEILPRNPADNVDPPPLAPKEFPVLTEEQATAMIQGMRTDRYAAMYILALTTGMRVSELLGVSWDNIFMQHRRIRVAKTLKRIDQEFFLDPLKSRTSRRDIPLAPVAIDALLAWKKTQEDDKHLSGKAWSNHWNLVFTTEVGTPIDYTSALRRFQRLMKTLELPVIRLHDLRHTYATLLIERGVPIKGVSELLGHATVTITLSTYGHVTPKMQDIAMQEIDQLFALQPIIDSPKINAHGYSHGEEEEQNEHA